MATFFVQHFGPYPPRKGVAQSRVPFPLLCYIHSYSYWNHFLNFISRIIHNGLLLLYAVDTLHDIVNVTASENWNESCSKLTKDVFGEIVGALYVQQYRPDHLDTLANRVSLIKCTWQYFFYTSSINYFYWNYFWVFFFFNFLNKTFRFNCKRLLDFLNVLKKRLPSECS